MTAFKRVAQDIGSLFVVKTEADKRRLKGFAIFSVVAYVAIVKGRELYTNKLVYNQAELESRQLMRSQMKIDESEGYGH